MEAKGQAWAGAQAARQRPDHEAKTNAPPREVWHPTGREVARVPEVKRSLPTLQKESKTEEGATVMKDRHSRRWKDSGRDRATRTVSEGKYGQAPAADRPRRRSSPGGASA